jgi:catechol 2,3-dioxygenase-like lactoylglutathione lyase family enzyme
MGEVLALEHVALIVSDLESSRHFYQDVLGLDNIERVEHAGPALEKMFGLKGVDEIEYRMRAPRGPGPGGRAPGFTIDLIQHRAPKGAQRRPSVNEIPTAHFAFGVKDLQATYERLKAQGVDFVSPPVTFPEEEGGWKVLFFRDPDGYLLELVQVG